jgi:hypothetical protein
MQTYRQFLEGDEVLAIDSPASKFKENVSDSVNHLLSQLEENSDDASLIQSDVFRFKVELESLNEDSENIIQNKKLYLDYQKAYESLLSTLEGFEEPPTDLGPLVSELKTELNKFYEFVQMQIAL